MRAGDFSYLDQPTPVGLAHRGGAAFGPNVGLENTLAAFRRAVSMGYRYLETDVHTSSDGVLLAFHDHVLDRVTSSVGSIVEASYVDLRTALIGGSEPIPRMADLLEHFPSTRFNIDLKQPGSDAQSDKWQKLYYRGLAPDGAPTPAQAHRTRLRLKPFKTKPR